MKYTLLLTQRCNLACSYCYIRQRPARMTLEVVDRVLDFAYRTAPRGERVEFGMFGGEPLLEFDLLTEVVERIERHPEHRADRTSCTVVSNGTLLTRPIAEYLQEHDVALGISCDGAPEVHDSHRVFRSGRGSSAAVTRTIRRAVDWLGGVMVNAVYGPSTLGALPETVAYLSSLGVRQIYLNPDFGARWGTEDRLRLYEVYSAIGDFYVEAYRRGDPHFVSLVDGKIAVILRGGYRPLEHCRMGRAEFAFTPEGVIYPCERLVGDGLGRGSIGDVFTGLSLGAATHCASTPIASNAECRDCGIRDYCMNWCGCSNYFATGEYDRVNAFICANEKAQLRVALRAYETLSAEGHLFVDHAGGCAVANSLAERPAPVLVGSPPTQHRV